MIAVLPQTSLEDGAARGAGPWIAGSGRQPSRSPSRGLLRVDRFACRPLLATRRKEILVSQTQRLHRLDRRLRRRHQAKRLRLLRHLLCTEPVTTVLERREVERLDILATERGMSREEVLAVLVRSGLKVCEAEAAGDVEAPPRSRPRLKRGAR
jgi:hypothetical protein